MLSLADLDPSEGLALYTDGSAWDQDGSGAWAWLIHDAFGNQTHATGKATDDTTNNRMEIQAWIEGLEAILIAHGPCLVIVYSDSEYVGLGAIDRSRRRNKNVDLWQLLDTTIDQHRYVEYSHIRGHSGHRLNNIVDELAKETRRSDNTTACS